MRWAEVFKINSDMTKPLNALINDMHYTTNTKVEACKTAIDNKVTNNTKVFTSNGTFVVPAGVYGIFVTACGGGGGGGGGYGGSYTEFNGGDGIFGGGGAGGGGFYNTITNNGGGGGGADAIYRVFYKVNPSQIAAVEIGRGGAGGAESRNGSAGGTTTLGGIVSLGGGGGGQHGHYGEPGVGGGYGGGSGGKSCNNSSIPGRDGIIGRAGMGATANVGGGSLGAGGITESAISTPHLYVVDKMIGCGMCFGAPKPSYSSLSRGGRGGDGIVIIEW